MIPSSNIEAEQSLIGSMIIDSDIIADVGSHISSEYFYEQSNKHIYKAIMYLESKNVEVDLITLKSMIDKWGLLESLGGMTYLVELTEIVPSSSSYRNYMNLIIECYNSRQLLGISNNIGYDLNNNLDTSQVMENLEANIKLYMSSGQGTDIKKLEDVLMDRYNQLCEIVENPEIKSEGIKTGFIELDRYLGGLHSGNMTVLAGRPGSMKTTLALNIAKNVALQGKRVVFFSMEMSEHELIDRLIAGFTSINNFLIRTGKLNEKYMEELQNKMDEIGKLDIQIDATANMTPALMKSRLNRANMSGKVDLVIVDYLGLMRDPTQKGSNKTNEVGEISRKLKMMAKDFDCPIIVLSQLSRECEKRGDKRPLASDLRSSGDIEQDADQIIMLYRDIMYDEFSERKNELEIIIRKNRHGATGTSWVNTNLNKQTLYNIDENGNILK